MEIGGVWYAPHAGESVTLIGGKSSADEEAFIGALEMSDKAQQLNAAEQDGEGMTPELRALAKEIAGYYGNLLATVRRRMVRWTWTDEAGEPLPPPRDPRDPIPYLRIEEQQYLIRLCNQEPVAAQKNGSKPSPISSSESPATGPAQTAQPPLTATDPS